MDHMKKVFPPISSVRKMAKRLKGEHLGESGLGSLTNAVKHLKNECVKKIIGDRFKSVKADRTGVKYLPPPNKSANDKKIYKVIQLRNGLRALLVSDTENLMNLAPEDCSLEGHDDDDEEDAASEEEFSDENLDDDDEEEEDIDVSEKDMEGEQDSEWKAKAPGITEKRAAVGLCVGVGSFSDPERVQGLAHFLEHMVFMGSEKFPQENDFDVFVQKHGGCDNASTECEVTNYFFECHEKRLLRTMDKFAQFFISPLMKREAMTREREAVESEFQLSITSDTSRRMQLVASMAKPNHPAAKFSWGNLKTLKENISDDELYDYVHKFRIRHYSAHRMTLAIQARLPLDVLEEWVIACFSPVPTNYLSEDVLFSARDDAFDCDRFCKMYTVKPMKDILRLNLTWIMPPMRHFYRVKPVEYVAWFLGHEGKGGLLSYLRNKVWALEMSVGVEKSDFENNDMYCLFEMSVCLTEAGLSNVQHVIEAIFGYIKLLQEKGPQEWAYSEMQKIEEARFRFADDLPPGDYVEWLCSNMHYYPPEDYLTGEDLYFEYDPDIIKICLNSFTLNNMNVMLWTKNSLDRKEFDQVEPWFGTQYYMQNIPADWLELWKNAVPDTSFALPEPNKFISTDFTLVPMPSATELKEQIYPVKILDNEYMELFYRQDVKFNLPSTYIYLKLLSPYITQSACNAAMLELFLCLLRQQLVEELYPALVAQLQFDIQAIDRGMTIKCWGFSHKVPVLLDSVVSGICKFKANLDPLMFEAVKKEKEKHYYNHILRAEKLLTEVRLSILLETYYTTLDKLLAFSNITMESLTAFVDLFFHDLYFQGLTQGNLSKRDALEACQNVVRTLRCKALPQHLIPQAKVAQIPQSEKFCRVKNFNPEDTNSITGNYYQFGKGTIKDQGILELVTMLMDEPLFNTLRTQEQLGYAVYCSLLNSYGILGQEIIVHSRADKFSVDHIDQRIEAFLRTFIKELKKVKAEEFSEVLQSLIKLKQCSDVFLKEEADRNWDEITSQEYIFDRREREIEYLKNLKQSSVIKWFTTNFGTARKSCARKLSIQVIGTAKNSDVLECDEVKVKRAAESEAQLNTLEQSVEDKSVFVKSLRMDLLTNSKTHPKNLFITDIQEFKKDLFMYPAHKIVS